MLGPHNAQDFIRALKAPSDPPQPGGLSKVDIARRVWHDTSLYVPNKAEAILDWLLSRLLKDKSRERSENPVADTRYWNLLCDILFHTSHEKDARHPRTLKAWLVPLLNRIPTAPVFLSYLDILSSGRHIDVDQFKLFSRAISALWPLAVPKFSPETLLDCFGAVMQLSVSPAVSDPSCGKWHALDDLRALSVIVSSYQTSLNNSTAKTKQLYAAFLKKHLPRWLHVTSRWQESECESAALVIDIYNAGIETIFALDILKQGADQRNLFTEALASSLEECPAIVLQTLPRLFTSYVDIIKRHKGALFSSGSSQTAGHPADSLQRLAMSLYSTCDSLAGKVTDESAWRCRASLLDIVERENLLSQDDEDAKGVLRRNGNIAVEALAETSDDDHCQRTHNAVEMLAILARIDHDLISASFVTMFPRLAMAPLKVSSALPYLIQLLEYDSKTRTLPAFILHLSGALSVQHLRCASAGPASSYQIMSAGPLTCLAFLDELSRAVHSFLTPGQVLDTVRDVSRCLQDTYERFAAFEARIPADHGDGPRKKRKKNAPLPEDRSEGEYHAVSFVLVVRVLAVVLRSLPLHNVTEDVRSEAERLIFEMHSAVVCRALEEGLGTPESRESRSWQFTVTGALRLHYSLARSNTMRPKLPLALGDNLTAVMLAYMSTENTIPELVVEMLRTFLLRCNLEALHPEAIISGMLDYVDGHLDHNSVWSGRDHCLDAHGVGAVAVLHLLADRWLPYFDERATSEQLGRLVKILFDSTREDPQSQVPSGMSVRHIVSKLSHNAQFWEMLRIRDIFLAQLNDRTALVKPIALSTQLSASTPLPPTDEICNIASVYEVLLLTPPEYLPRPMHIEYIKRGFVADCIVLRTLRHAKKAAVLERHLLVIREGLRRSIAHLGTVEFDGSTEYLEYLLEHTAIADTATEALLWTTRQLIDMYQGSLVRNAKQNDNALLVNLARRYTAAFSGEGSDLIRTASLLLVNCLVASSSKEDFPMEFRECLRELHQCMLKYSLPRLGLDRAQSLDSGLLDIWSHVCDLGQWLDVQGDEVPLIGQELLQRLLKCVGEDQDRKQLGPVVMSISLAELREINPGDNSERIEYVAVAYLTLFRIFGCEGLVEVESRLSGAFRTMSTTTFTALCHLLREDLPLHRGLSIQDVTSLIRLSAIALCAAPEGTSKICQTHTTRCLDIFVNDERFTTLPELRREVLGFIVRQCNERPASLRTVDLSGLWTLLRAFLTGSPEHEHATDPAIFHGIVNVLSALIRLRRDLILNTLPHLGFILRRLTHCLVSPRPQLGGKQHRLVMDRLPRWIAPATPLSAPESRALARLLTTLTTKTLVRGHETKKPESLVRPFSKHAAYVLTAYVEAVNDPLCVVSAAVRKELQPGLYALCDMLGEHNRDAMMVSTLDAGGKATMKALWKEYEKQRYVGKG